MNQPEDSSTGDRPPSLWRYWLKRLAWSLFLLLATLLCTLALSHHRHSKRLDEALAELDRAEPGWRLRDIEEAREPVPDAENSALIVVDVARRLPRGWPSSDFSALYADLPAPEQLGAEDFTQLEQELDRQGTALLVARRLADMPRGRHQLEYKRFVLDTLLGDQQESRRVVSLLVYDAARHGQRQDLKAALRSCRAALNAARALGDEPFAISQLIRTAGVLLACQGIERTLGQGEPAPEDLAAMQPLLRNEDAFADHLVVAGGERASLHEAFAALEGGLVPLSQLEGKRPDWQDRALGWFTREKLLEAHPTMLALSNRWLTIAQLPPPEQLAAEKEFDKEVRERKQSEPLAVLLLPALAKVADASRRKHAYLRCADAALACERYRREHKEWPASLDSLCPHFLPAVPLDPFDGKPLRFKRLADGVSIYSVSSDGTDNGGNFDRQNPTLPGVDVGLQLWDVAKRRQPPRPRPKPPEAKLPPLPPGMPPR